MEPNNSLQNEIRCFFCKEKVPELHCQLCDVKVCKACIGEHLLDDTKKHIVDVIQKEMRAPKFRICPTHSESLCELHCEDCDVSCCLQCITTEEHEKHNIVGISQNVVNKKEALRIYLLEFEKSILPKYEAAASVIGVKKAALNANSQTLRKALIKQGGIWHRAIDTFINKMQSEIGVMDYNARTFIVKQEETIRDSIEKISQTIKDLKELIHSNDSYKVSNFKLKMSENRKSPLQVKISLPNFSPGSIDSRHFGSLSKLSMETIERIYTIDSIPVNKTFKKFIFFGKRINVKCPDLRHVSCQSGEGVWISGSSKYVMLYDFKGQLSKLIETISGNAPDDITVTNSGILHYIDRKDKSVNIVKEALVQPLIKLNKWQPCSVCKIYFGDLLVMMDSVDHKQTKIVRYSESREIQSIRWEDKNPFYSSFEMKSLRENRNLDICVADLKTCAVVVMNGNGNIRFKYTGSPEYTPESFCPHGIETDSQARILTMDINKRLHIIDQDGRFLRFFHTFWLQYPMSFCVDSQDNIHMTEGEEVETSGYYE